MADEPPTQALVTESKAEESPAPSAAADATENEPTGADTATNAGGDAKVATDAVTESGTADDANGAAETTVSVTQDSSEAAGAATNADAATNGTPAPAKKNSGKRKSAAGVSDHSKAKGTPKGKGKKAPPQLHLSAEPGQLWFAHMKGHQPWPAIICDEEMLPESLLSKRPVSAARVDGTYREDFNEGGKNARDRRYPIMFLATNEFAWQQNTELQPLDIEDVKRVYTKDDRGKKSQSLWEAYGVAGEGHDLAWFKNMLAEHEAAMRADAEEREQKAVEKEAKKEKKARRKSDKVDEDVEMEDADTPELKKSASKKRKKEAEDDELDTPKPRTKLKVNGPKTPSSDTPAKPKSHKKAKKVVKTSDDEELPNAEEGPSSDADRREKRQKTVLYLRHRLQKGFLNRETEPKEEEMHAMSSHFVQLEQFHDLEPEIIKATKIHKVLKGIVRLNSIPKDDELNFKKRSNDLLNVWNKTLAAETETPVTADALEAATNGVSKEDKNTDSKASDAEDKDETPAPTKEDTVKVDAPKAVENGDETMEDAEEASAESPKIESSIEVPTTETTEAAVAT